LGPDEIHVWLHPLVIKASTQDLLHSYLSADEKRRAARFHFERDRIRFIAARGTLRTLLGQYLSKQPGELQFHLGQQGKPSLAPEPAGRSLSFNLSHSEDFAAFAFGWNRNIGVDIERIRPGVEHEDIAQCHFSAAEIESLVNLPPADQAKGFFVCWTRKEAYIKASGRGLQIPLDSFDVNLEPGTAARFLRGVDPSWRIIGFEADQQYPAALVYDGPPADLRFLTLDPNTLE
jgi:4'-phosphopantetheinyl transferase